jgi:hypothetical protein
MMIKEKTRKLIIHCFWIPEIELVDTQDYSVPGYVLVMLHQWHTLSNALYLYISGKFKY